MTMGDAKDSMKKVAQDGRARAERALSGLDAAELGRKAKEAAYTLVGLGVMGAQRANAATRDAIRRLGHEGATPVSLDLDSLRARTKDLSDAARRQFGSADEVLGGALARIEEALSPLQVHLPGSARETMDKVKDAGRELHAQVRSIVLGAHDDHADAEGPDTQDPAA